MSSELGFAPHLPVEGDALQRGGDAVGRLDQAKAWGFPSCTGQLVDAEFWSAAPAMLVISSHYGHLCTRGRGMWGEPGIKRKMDDAVPLFPHMASGNRLMGLCSHPLLIGKPFVSKSWLGLDTLPCLPLAWGGGACGHGIRVWGSS